MQKATSYSVIFALVVSDSDVIQPAAESSRFVCAVHFHKINMNANSILNFTLC